MFITYLHIVSTISILQGGLFIKFNSPGLGSVVENFVFSELKRRFIPNEELFFWRTLGGANEIAVILGQLRTLGKRKQFIFLSAAKGLISWIEKN